MIGIRRSNERGKSETNWLESYHSFSFNRYYDPANMNFGPLRVLNDDKIKAGQGFGRHPHSDMEIVTYVLSGAIEHRDSTGSRGVIQSGDVQRMSAGTGIEHSEYNHSEEHPVRLIQVWFLPAKMGMAPSYEQKHFSIEERTDVLLPVASSAGHPGAVHVEQDVTMFISRLAKGRELSHKIEQGRGAYLYIMGGAVSVGPESLSDGDAAELTEQGDYKITAEEKSEIVLFDLVLV